MPRKLTDYVADKEQRPVFEKPAKKITEATEEDIALVEEEVVQASEQMREAKDPLSEDFKTIAQIMATLENKIDALTESVAEFQAEAEKKNQVIAEQMETNAKAVSLLEKIQKELKADKNAPLMEQIEGIKSQLENPVQKETVRIIERDEHGRIAQMVDREQPIEQPTPKTRGKK